MANFWNDRRRCNHRLYCDRQSVGYSNFFWGNCYISTPHIRVKRRWWTLLNISGGRRCREAIDVCQSCRSSSMYDKISKSTNSFNSQNLRQILPDETQKFSWIFRTVFLFLLKPKTKRVKNNHVFEKPYSPTQFSNAFEDGNYSGLFIYFRILTSIDFWGLIWFLLKPENQRVKNNQVFERLDSPTHFSEEFEDGQLFTIWKSKTSCFCKSKLINQILCLMRDHKNVNSKTMLSYNTMQIVNYAFGSHIWYFRISGQNYPRK